MIYLNSLLDVLDNSGILKFKYINTLKQRITPIYGDILIGIVYKLYNNNLYKKSDKCKGILVQQKKLINFKNYYSIKFNKNAVIIINNTFKSIGTKSKYYISKYLRNNKNYNIKNLKIKLI